MIYIKIVPKEVDIRVIIEVIVVKKGGINIEIVIIKYNIRII